MLFPIWPIILTFRILVKFHSYSFSWTLWNWTWHIKTLVFWEPSHQMKLLYKEPHIVHKYVSIRWNNFLSPRSINNMIRIITCTTTSIWNFKLLHACHFEVVIHVIIAICKGYVCSFAVYLCIPVSWQGIPCSSVS